jgi:hypothetical protein
VIPAHDLRSALCWTLGLLAPLAALALLLGFTLEPEALARGAPWHLLGLQAPACPGCALCGLSRAFAAIGHGRWQEALAFHPGVVLAWPGAWLVALGGPWLLARSLAPRTSSLRRRTWRSPR